MGMRIAIILSDMRLLVAVLAGLLSPISQSEEFDHDSTRFPLRGFHRLVECESCHVGGRFKGTPHTCFLCHSSGAVITGGGKSMVHPATTNDCADCHRTDSWQATARFDHSQVLGACAQCHNGSTQPGKPASHVPTNQACDTCHNTFNWGMARFDHSGITAACSSCHNGNTATGKSARHLLTTAECNTCHNTRAWVPAGFDHSSISQPCSSCHNGTTATGKSRNHLNTMAECDGCHSTRAWLPAQFDHNNITSSCSSCHNGTTATGKNSGHFITNTDCDSCHVTTRWAPVNYVHHGAGYPGEHRQALECKDCHIGNSETAVWKFPAYQPDCAGCHANSYRSGEHTKVSSPRISYTVSELRDCSGSCHTYTDSSMTTIKRMRSGHHRVTDSSFGD